MTRLKLCAKYVELGWCTMSDLLKRAESASRGLANLGMDDDSELVDELIARIDELERSVKYLKSISIGNYLKPVEKRNE